MSDAVNATTTAVPTTWLTPADLVWKLWGLGGALFSFGRALLTATAQLPYHRPLDWVFESLQAGGAAVDLGYWANHWTP